MAVSPKLRWKRYINELRFVNEELEFVREIVKEISGDFQIHYESFCVKNGVDLAALNREHNDKIEKSYNVEEPKPNEDESDLESETDGALVPQDEPSDESLNSEEDTDSEQQSSDYQMTRDELEIHEAFNKVFRKIAMLIHPDKLDKNITPEEREEKLNMFKETKAALEDRKYFVILDVAQQFNISVPKNYRQQIRWMKKETVKLNESVELEKSTYNYLFSECDTDMEKDNIIRKFMFQLFGPKVFDK